MDSKELLNLQEAYLEVFDNQQFDEAKADEGLTPLQKIRKRNKAYAMPGERAGDQTSNRRSQRASARGEKKEKGAKKDLHLTMKYVGGPYKGDNYSRYMGKTQKEQVDIYDIILSHLLDEGYAETPEAAEAIMVNMSEEWREDIVEETLDERNRGEQGMSDREVTRRRNLGGNVRSKVSASSLGDHGPQSAIQKFHKTKANQRRAIHKSGRYTRGDTGESGGQGRYQANKDHSDGYPSITKRGQGPG